MARRFDVGLFGCGKYQAEGWDDVCEPSSDFDEETESAEVWESAPAESGGWTDSTTDSNWTETDKPLNTWT